MKSFDAPGDTAPYAGQSREQHDGRNGATRQKGRENHAERGRPVTERGQHDGVERQGQIGNRQQPVVGRMEMR